MDQDIDGVYGESTECGNLFSMYGEILDEIKIKFEDESDGFDDPFVLNINTNCITDFSGENKECGNSFTKMII